ncbi:hypothetical protein [Faecalicatena contorta]|uniref:hypothetical protein n=1 Tax=Faecalicatena contorta TaxID=39482 RepID=UPI00189746EB|nr:hypothetical protein [Faecalicatena contorta]
MQSAIKIINKLCGYDVERDRFKQKWFLKNTKIEIGGSGPFQNGNPVLGKMHSAFGC